MEVKALGTKKDPLAILTDRAIGSRENVFGYLKPDLTLIY